MGTHAPATVRELLRYMPPADPSVLCPPQIRQHLRSIVARLERVLGSVDEETGQRSLGNFDSESNRLLAEIWATESFVEIALLKQETAFAETILRLKQQIAALPRKENAE